MDDLRKILKMSLLVGKTVDVRIDDVALDVDGVPSSVGPSTFHDDVEVLGVVITESELARQGLLPADVPHLTVIHDLNNTEGEIHDR